MLLPPDNMPSSYGGDAMDTAALVKAADNCLDRYHRQGQQHDLYTSIDYYRKALSIAPEDKALESALSTALLVRFQEEENDDDIRECISLAESVLLNVEESDLMCRCYLRHLGYSLATWADKKPKKAGEILDRALRYLAKSVRLAKMEATDDAIRCRFEYAHALYTFGNYGTRKEEVYFALHLLNQALELTPNGHHLRHSTLYFGALIRWPLFSHSNKLSYINDAIGMAEEAIDLLEKQSRQRTNILDLLGCLLYIKYLAVGQADLLDLAMGRFKEAVEVTPDHVVRKFTMQGNYFETLLRRYTARSQLEDLHLARDGLQAVLEKLPPEFPFPDNYTTFLGCALQYSFSEYGKRHLLDSAIGLHEKAITKARADTKSYCYRNLAQAYHARFHVYGDQTDLDKSVTHIREAQNHCRQGYLPTLLSILGEFLITRFTSLGRRDDIDEAVSVFKRHLDLTLDPKSPHSAETHSLLGHAFLQRYSAYHDQDDLNMAISQQQDAILLLPEDHIVRPTAYFRLGNVFTRMFETTQMVADIQKAISAYTTAANLICKGRAIRATYLCELGKAKHKLFCKTDQPADIESVFDVLREATADVQSSTAGRFNAATLLARLAHDRNLHNSALEGYRLAVELLPKIVWLGLDHRSRLQQLTQQSMGLCQNAAACAICLGQLEVAVELIDRGRWIVFNASQDLRTNSSHLNEVDPRLAREFHEISAALDSRSFRSKPPPDCNQEQDARSHRRLADQWDELLQKIRMLKGFERFLIPLDFVELQKAAHGGVIVVINISPYRCDALVIMEEGPVRLVPLPDFCYTAIQQTASALDQAVRVPKDEAGENLVDDVLLEALRTIWHVVGRPLWKAISALPSANSRPRVWWCPTGLLTCLPIHACGPYDGVEKGMPEVVVSSYTPTISVLHRVKMPHPSRIPRVPFSMLAVGVQGGTVTEAMLPGTSEELDVLQGILRTDAVTYLKESEATIPRVKELMKTHSWLHMATDGTQLPTPFESHLNLYEGPLYLSDIARACLPHAEFAYISACHSAKAHISLPDEVFHIGAGMLSAGYKGVLGTLWCIADEDGPKVARPFYKHLTRSGGDPDVRDTAEALHKATRHLRNTLPLHNGAPTGLWRWVPFVHLGV